jgi:hypothetical protein
MGVRWPENMLFSWGKTAAFLQESSGISDERQCFGADGVMRIFGKMKGMGA